MVVYEVELRSKISEQRFNSLKGWLDKHADFLGEMKMKSYLFPKPSFLRIRFMEGKNTALVTEKTSSYSEAGRIEKEFEIPNAEVAKFVKEKTKQGYSECSLAKTIRFSYKFNGLKVELNKNNLGLIVEIEAITKNKKEIPVLQNKIRTIMKKVKLKELSPSKYQEMMNELYAKTLKPITKYKFAIA